MKPLFGPAGRCDMADKLGHKSTTSFLKYIEQNGLTAFEYQFGRGVRISVEKTREIGDAARASGITVSAHAPYYISLASEDEQKRLNSLGYILETAVAVNGFGGRRIVVHPGGLGGVSRAEATARAKITLELAQKMLDEAGLSDVIICPEVMGKINQLGDLDEVLEFCGVDERMLPCVDFGHLNSRTRGSLVTKADFLHVLEHIENKIGIERASVFHVHFSKIEYSTGGEKKHLTFEDTVYGPAFEPFIEAIAERGFAPVVICESRGTQTADAVTMMRYDGDLRVEN